MPIKSPGRNGISIGTGNVSVTPRTPVYYYRLEPQSDTEFNRVCFLWLLFYRREPHSLLKPSKDAVVDNDKIEKVKPKATRNLILIRHGQYNLTGMKDDERFLTALGNTFV